MPFSMNPIAQLPWKYSEDDERCFLSSLDTAQATTLELPRAEHLLSTKVWYYTRKCVVPLMRIVWFPLFPSPPDGSILESR